MKDRYRFKKNTNEPHFITIVVKNKVPVFTNNLMMNIIIENFRFYQKKGLKIYFYVIMDNHLHMIAAHDNDLSQIISNFKSYSAGQLIETVKKDKREWVKTLFKNEDRDAKYNYNFWEAGSHPKIINGWDMLEQKALYIHNNPVKRGLVEKPEDWIYSSAREFYQGDGVFRIDRF